FFNILNLGTMNHFYVILHEPICHIVLDFSVKGLQYGISAVKKSNIQVSPAFADLGCHFNAAQSGTDNGSFSISGQVADCHSGMACSVKGLNTFGKFTCSYNTVIIVLASQPYDQIIIR